MSLAQKIKEKIREKEKTSNAKTWGDTEFQSSDDEIDGQANLYLMADIQSDAEEINCSDLNSYDVQDFIGELSDEHKKALKMGGMLSPWIISGSTVQLKGVILVYS